MGTKEIAVTVKIDFDVEKFKEFLTEEINKQLKKTVEELTTKLKRFSPGEIVEMGIKVSGNQ